MAADLIAARIPPSRIIGVWCSGYSTLFIFCVTVSPAVRLLRGSGASGDVLGVTWGGLGLPWMPLGGVLGGSWADLGGSWSALGRSWGGLVGYVASS